MTRPSPPKITVTAMANDEPDNELDEAVLDALKYTLAVHLCRDCRSALVSSRKESALVEAYRIVADYRTPSGSIRFHDDDIAEAMGHRLTLTPEDCPVCNEQDEAFAQP